MTAEETMAVQAAPETSLEAQNQSKGILAGGARLETALRRLEEQSALQAVLAKKRLFYARLSAAFLAVTAIAVVWMVGQVIPQMERTLGTANTTMADVDLVMQQLAMADIPGILENLDQTLSEGRESIAEASTGTPMAATSPRPPMPSSRFPASTLPASIRPSRSFRAFWKIPWAA